MQSSIACSCSSDIYVLQLLCLSHSRMPRNSAPGCVPSRSFSSNALKSVNTASRCFPSRRFVVPWIRASHMTWSSWVQTDHHQKGGHCRWQHCSPDDEQGMGEWAVWFQSRECDIEWLWLVAGCWDCDSWRSNCPGGSFHVHVHVSRLNTVARLCMDKCVRPNVKSSGSSDSGRWHRMPWKHLSRGRHHPTRSSFRAASWMAFKIQHLSPCQPVASSRVLFWGNWLWPSPLGQVRKHIWWCENDAWSPPYT